MHKNMHSAKCQMQNEAARFVGAGRPPGEPPEIFWAILGLLGPATQYMDPVNRRGRIERQVQWMEQESDVKHAPLLMRFEARAFEAKSLARGNLCNLQHEISEQGIHIEEVKKVSVSLTTSPSENVAMPWDAKYAQLVIQAELIESSDTSAFFPASLVIPGSKFTPTFKAKVLAQIKKLERVHLGGKPMALDAPEFEAAFFSLVDYEVNSRTEGLARLVSRYNFLESLMNKVAGRPQEVRKLKRGKAALHSQISTAYATILEWIDHPRVQQVGQRRTFSFITESEFRDSWKLEDALTHRYPWIRVSPNVEDGRKLHIWPFAQRYRRYLQEYNRAVEEENLVKEEKISTLKLYETQLEALRAALLEVDHRIQQVDGDVEVARQAYEQLIESADSADAPLEGEAAAAPHPAQQAPPQPLQQAHNPDAPLEGEAAAAPHPAQQAPPQPLQQAHNPDAPLEGEAAAAPHPAQQAPPQPLQQADNADPQLEGEAAAAPHATHREAALQREFRAHGDELFRINTSLSKLRAELTGRRHVIHLKEEQITLRLKHARKLFGMNDVDYASVEELIHREVNQPYRHLDTSLHRVSTANDDKVALADDDEEELFDVHDDDEDGIVLQMDESVS